MMRAMQLDRPREALRLVRGPIPVPAPGELLILISACGICWTDLHIVDGDLNANFPVVPGHEIVGRVIAAGEGARFQPGARVGVPWLGGSCGRCPYCRSGRENLCDDPVFTGCSRDGGFATHCVARDEFCFALPDAFDDIHAAPLLCAGLIGYRAFKLAEESPVVGLYGFGAAAHILVQVAVHEGRRVHAFTRPGDESSQKFALSLGCAWAGGSDQAPPEPLNAAIIFAPVGALVPTALKQVRKGGRVICAGIHMSDIPAFPYADLWGERSLCSVANLTRSDGEEFFSIAAQVPVKTVVTSFPLSQANEALELVRGGAVDGAAVLCPGLDEGE